MNVLSVQLARTIAQCGMSSDLACSQVASQVCRINTPLKTSRHRQAGTNHWPFLLEVSL